VTERRVGKNTTNNEDTIAFDAMSIDEALNAITLEQDPGSRVESYRRLLSDVFASFRNTDGGEQVAFESLIDHRTFARQFAFNLSSHRFASLASDVTED
jgi:hypothetical protein